MTKQVVLSDSDSNESRPYLSVVVTARNDDHGGNLLSRMQTFVNALLAQAKRHNVSTELVVVDWNPPAGKVPLVDALRWPTDLGPVEARFIEVSPELHSRYRHGQALPLYQMIAKNVGIRRARGRFILATNIDVIFSHEMFEYFAAQRLERGYMYRVDRYDTAQDVPVDASIDEQLEYCKTHLIRVNTRQGSFPVSTTGQRIIESNDIVSPTSAICLGNGWYPLEGDLTEQFRWVYNDAEIYVGPAEGDAVLLLELEPGPGVGFRPFALRVLDRGGAILQEVPILRRQIVRLDLGPLPEPTVIRLDLAGGGHETAYDPRILNFRAFRVRWEHEPEASQDQPGAAAAGAPGNAKHGPGLQSLPKRIWNTVSTIRSASGPVPVGVPLPAFIARMNPRLEGNSIVLTVGGRSLRGRHSKPVKVQDQRTAVKNKSRPSLVAEDVDLLWGKGWYPPEFYKGEHFRWGRSGAELILCTPEGGAAPLRVKIEPGPALGYGPFHLLVRDSSGRTVATAAVSRRQWIDLPLRGEANRSQVFSLHAQGTREARVLANDPRSLSFRILAVQWAPGSTDKAQPSDATRKTPWTPVSAPPGFLLGYGWRPEVDAGGLLTWVGEPGAEIVVQGNRFSRDPLLLDLEPANPEVALEVLVLEGERQLGTRLLTGREEVCVGINLEEEQSAVLRLTVRQEGAAPENPANCAVRLLRAAWWGFDGPPPERAFNPAQVTAADPSAATAPPPPPVGAAYLHTNACGDFTLLAREHWFDLRAYPEFDLFSMNLDSVFCYAAHHGGAPEKVLPDPIRVYHIEHATGSGFTPEGQTKLFERIAAKGLSWISYEQVLDWATEMRRLGMPLIFNREDWGFAAVDLPERRVDSHSAATS